MAIKIDLEKAYDRLRWDFIEETLVLAHFPTTMIQIIMRCITTLTMQVLWNGEASRTIYPAKGIQQGDPLSPYIFILYMKRLSRIINKAVSNKEWSPISTSKRGIPFSYLFFYE